MDVHNGPFALKRDGSMPCLRGNYRGGVLRTYEMRRPCTCESCTWPATRELTPVDEPEEEYPESPPERLTNEENRGQPPSFRGTDFGDDLGEWESIFWRAQEARFSSLEEAFSALALGASGCHFRVSIHC